MRHNPRRSSRGGKPQQRKNTRTRAYDSNGPDVRIRGTAFQVTEKYMNLSKDAETSGNIVMAENYRQHAEHYQRIINSFEEIAAATANKNNNAQPQQQTNANAVKDEAEDLGLPASIVGKAVEVAEPEKVSA